MNEFGNSYSTFFQLVKTSKNINEIKEKVSDRLIITKQGKLYFDYSNNERIEISTVSENYIYESEFTAINDTLFIPHEQIMNTNGDKISIPSTNTLIFDKNGNMGMIINNDSTGTSKVYVLTKNFTATQVMDMITIKRYDF